MANSTVSSLNEVLDAPPHTSPTGSMSQLDPILLLKKSAKIDKCIISEERNLHMIQDELIKLGMSPDRNPAKHQQKIRELEQANDQASRQIEEYKKKKSKYESALRSLEEAQARTRRLSKDDGGRKSATLPLPAPSTAVDSIKPGTRVLNFIRQTRNGDGGSAKSKESRGSKDESPAPATAGAGTIAADTSNSRIPPSDISVSSLESDSRDSQKRQKRLDEITEILDAKLDPLASYMQHVKERMEEVYKSVEESRVEHSDLHKSNTAVLDDIIRRCAYVEEQIHDIIELHQKETAETKTYLADTQDKMNYIFHERMRDLREEVNALNTRIAKMEHRQTEDESLARTDATKSLMGEMAFKLVDCVLLVGQLVIAVVGAVSQFCQMTAENSTRLVLFLVGVIAVLVLLQFGDELPFGSQVSASFAWLCRIPGARLIFSPRQNETTL